MESPHTYDMRAACAGCGARWVEAPEIGEGAMKMDHVQPCRYLEDEEYGATLEIGEQPNPSPFPEEGGYNGLIGS
jgi:hypothetical protein